VVVTGTLLVPWDARVIDAQRRGFSLVELLVVVAVIALLTALIVPAGMAVRKQVSATRSMSNLRQWGSALTGFATDQKGKLPWEGYKNANQMAGNFSQKLWWANALPPYVGEEPYSEVSNQASAAGASVPMPPTTTSIFIDPSAQAGEAAPYTGGGKKFFFCYVPNAQLDATLEKQLQAKGVTDPLAARLSLSQIPKPALTVVMMELRTVKDELPQDDPFHGEDLKRHFGDWQRFAARHRRGGHMTFADGHVEHRLNVDATTNSVGTREDGPNYDMNKMNLVWDPLGPAFN
jgi:prepilin-type N-terminal cleavage/methylation domain-containing protein/prepilin-type processing-associated H-X9-DG protein